MSQLTPRSNRIGFHHPDTGERQRWQPPRAVADAAWIFFAVVWVVTITLVALSPETIEEIWAWIGDRHVALEVGIWVLFLPVMIGLAVWQSSWALWVRILILVACVLWTTIGFYPNRVASRGTRKEPSREGSRHL